MEPMMRSRRAALLFLVAGLSLVACKRKADPPWPPTRGTIEVSKGGHAGVLHFERGRIVRIDHEPGPAGAAFKAEIEELEREGPLTVKMHDPHEGHIGVTGGPGHPRYMQIIYEVLVDRGYGALIKSEAEP